MKYFNRNSLLVIITLLLIPMISGFISVWLGKDLNWDLKNYHYYNAYAFLQNRLEWDIDPAQWQTYLNPLADLPFYYMTQMLPAIVVGYILGFVHGLNIVLVFLISWLTLQIDKQFVRWIYVTVITIVSAIAPGFISELGTTFNDNLVSVFGLTAIFLLIVVGQKFSTNGSLHFGKIVFAGFLIGFGVGLKLTFGIYAIASGLSLAVLFSAWQVRIKAMLLYMFGGLAGLVLSVGYWSWKLWAIFGNPLLPAFNAIFRSPYVNFSNYSDKRFLPTTFLEYFYWPLAFTWNTKRVGEIQFSDVRFAVLYVLIILVGMKYLLAWLDNTVPQSHLSYVSVVAKKFLLVFGGIAFVIWMISFSIYRYAILLEVLVPLYIWIILEHLIWRRYLREIIAIFLITLILMKFSPPNWGRWNWETSFLHVDTSFIPTTSDRVVVMLGSYPTSYAIPFFPGTMRFIRPDGNLRLNEDTQIIKNIKHILRQPQNKDFYILYTATENINPDERIFQLGLIATKVQCFKIKSNFPDELVLCEFRQP